MSQEAPLAGLSIAVTRPPGQAGGLARGIEAAGGRAVLAPLLEIAATDNTAALQRVAGQLANYAAAVFVSPNAVDFALPILLDGRRWPDSVAAMAVGQGTVRALAAQGVSGAIAPTMRFDSESLLALPELQSVRLAGRRVLILRGDGGRELLADELSRRGACVELVTAYRRLPPVEGLQTLRRELAAGRLAALTLSSSEGLRYLVEGLVWPEKAVLARLPVFVPHARIAENAALAGISKIVLTGPADEGLLAGMCAYNWQLP